jgi:hypothetical protein
VCSCEMTDVTTVYRFMSNFLSKAKSLRFKTCSNAPRPTLFAIGSIAVTANGL